MYEISLVYTMSTLQSAGIIKDRRQTNVTGVAREEEHGPCRAASSNPCKGEHPQMEP